MPLNYSYLVLFFVFNIASLTVDILSLVCMYGEPCMLGDSLENTHTDI